MKEKVSFWLTFSKEDEFYLSKIIAALSKKYDAPFFIPHLTIYGGGLSIKTEKVKNIIAKTIKNIKSSIVDVDKIHFSDDLWKSIIIEIKMNKFLETIYEQLRKELIIYKDYNLKPHVSLIYKQLSTKEKTKIIKSLKIKKYFLIDKIAVCSYIDARKVNEWKILFRKKL